MIYKQRTDEEKQRTRKLIDIGGLVNKAGMADYPKPFLLGLFLKCKREIVPRLSRQELDELSEIGFTELQKRGQNKQKPKPKKQPEPPKEGPKPKPDLTNADGLEPWMMF